MNAISRSLLCVVLSAGPVVASAAGIGSLYTMSNAAGGNEVLIFERQADGSLSSAGRVATGGKGTGAGLGNQGAVVIGSDQTFLFAVNAGSNSVSSFRLTEHGLELVGSVGSGGTRPVSLTEDRGRVFVLNAGDDANPGSINGFRVGPKGTLAAIARAAQPLSESGNTAPAQILFASDGRQLIVTEKATNRILTFRVDTAGVLEPAVVTESSGQTPFGFAVGNRDQVFVSNAAGGADEASSLSSYKLPRTGHLHVVSDAVGTGETAACWVALTPDERYAFTTNTASGTISSFSIAFDGTVKLAAAAAGSTGDGSGPIDMAVSPDGRFLYALNGGTDSIATFRINQFGALRQASLRNGLPVQANGLAVR